MAHDVRILSVFHLLISVVLVFGDARLRTEHPTCIKLEVSQSNCRGEVEGRYEWIGSCKERPYFRYTDASHYPTLYWTPLSVDVYIFFTNESQTSNFTGWVIAYVPCAYMNVLVRSADLASSPELVRAPWEERNGTLPFFITSEEFTVTCTDKNSSGSIAMYLIIMASLLVVLVSIVVGLLLRRRKSRTGREPQQREDTPEPHTTTEQTAGPGDPSAPEPPVYTLVTSDVLPPYMECDPHPLPQFESDIELQPHLENDLTAPPEVAITWANVHDSEV